MVVLMSHDTDTNTNVIIPLFMIQTKVGFPGLMSCVDFDMAQSSRYVGLCGILPISYHEDDYMAYTLYYTKQN